MNNLKIWNYFSIPWLSFVLLFFISFLLLAFINEADPSFITNNYLIDLSINTILLCALTAIISAFIAIPLAILTTLYKFPGQKFFSWSLSLSIAFPIYIYAFIYVGIFEYSGPLAQYFRQFDLQLPSVKNIFGASLIFSMALFPYIYLITKAQLASTGIKIFKAAKSLGNNNIQAIYKVIIPSLKPAIFGGMALIIFEIIADLGGVSTLRIDTFTIGIYDAWYGGYDYYTGARLAGYLLLFVFLLIFLNKYFNNQSYGLAPKTSETFEKIELDVTKSLFSTIICSIIFLIAFCLPLSQLLFWHFSESNISILDNLKLLLNSTIVGSFVAIVTVAFAISLTLSHRGSNKLKTLIMLSTSGYAIPGSILASGLLVTFGIIFSTSITIFGIYALIICLSIRFMTPAFNYIKSSLENIPSSSEKALETFGVKNIKAFTMFYLPQMRSAIFLGTMIVFIETIKEQPATLLLRPTNFDTLSTKIYNYTYEGEWALASSPSILLILLSLIFVYLINKNINIRNNF